MINRKTTQIPQFLIESDPNAKVVVCQPRRLAAIGVANRVAFEQGCQIGEVNYHPTIYIYRYYDFSIVGWAFCSTSREIFKEYSTSILHIWYFIKEIAI